MFFQSIKNDEEYWAVCAEIEPILFTGDPDTPEAARAEFMFMMVRAYEAENPHLADDPDRMPLAAMIDAVLEALGEKIGPEEPENP